MSNWGGECGRSQTWGGGGSGMNRTSTIATPPPYPRRNAKYFGYQTFTCDTIRTSVNGGGASVDGGKGSCNCGRPVHARPPIPPHVRDRPHLSQALLQALKTFLYNYSFIYWLGLFRSWQNAESLQLVCNETKQNKIKTSNQNYPKLLLKKIPK